MNSLDRAVQALEEHLRGLGFDKDSIDRIICQDLPFLTTWELAPNPPQELENADAVITFALGFGPVKEQVQHPPGQYHPQLFDPGKSNEALAEVIVPFAQKGLSIFAQWEVAEALNARGIAVPDHQIARPDRRYLGTSGVVEQFLANGLANFASVMLVAHPHHAFRCRETTKIVFQKNGKAISLLIADTRSVPYDPKSVQPWTRSLKAWVEYEVGNRFNNRFQGNM